MIGTVFTLIFVIIVLILGLLSKRTLYISEHEASILNEINTFDENFKSIESIENISDFKLGTGHMYGDN